MRRREVRRHQQGALLHAIGQQGVAALARQVEVFAETAVPLPQRHLHGIVQGIAREDRPLAARVEIDADLARRMTGCRLEREAAAHAVLARHELGLLRLDDRQHRIVVGIDLEGLRIGALGLGLPEIVVGARHHVLGVGKGRHPLAVLQPGVPADVIDVQVGAHHEVDLLGLDAGGAQPLEILGVQHVEARHARPRLVVAAARVDQDRVLARAQQPGMDRGHQPAALRLIVMRCQPFGLGCEGLGLEFRKEVFGREARPHLLLDARDPDVADVTVLHAYLPLNAALRFSRKALSPSK